MTLKDEFRKYGFATIDYPSGIRERVKQVMESWQNFCNLPIEIKSCLSYSKKTDTGYEFKDKIGATKDLKENFHLTLHELPKILKLAKKYDIDQSFIREAGSLLKEIQILFYKFSRLIEKEFNLINIENELYESRNKWLIRCLHYFPGSLLGQIIASHHVDKLGLTMYLGETTPGIQYYSKNDKWKNMPILSGKTIITPNLQMQYKTQGEIKGLYHRVIANKESSQNGRYAIVCFADFLQTPQYNKEKYGRTQDLPLAFNYGMDHKEFSKFFI
ncbi:hypothetical protein HY061_02020 [Candidatus Azambacteria bacterium]|nr:hypothetical protein [Candidatus Azambacteria bacterium]